MAIKCVKGFRDFYPDDMALRNYITDAWRRVSLRNGFVEYGGPILEYLELYKVKSGDEIVSQLFSLTDRGDRELAIRPEITPTLARMVNAKINSLPRPVKWFSIPRLCRAENPQKGRGREFFQWNVDVIGSDAVLADVDCIFTLADLLAELDLSPAQAKISLSSRSLIAAALAAADVPAESREAMLPVLDKRSKVTPEAFAEMCGKLGLSQAQMDKLAAFQDSQTLDEAVGIIGSDDDVLAEAAKLREIIERLAAMGAGEYCKLDLHVVRGLAYYTGCVYEAFDASASLRALAGGGRYDRLLETLGGPAVGATGFGMGDMVLAILLEESGKLPQFTLASDCYVIEAGDDMLDSAISVAAQLRRAGISAEFSYQRRSMGKLMKAAAKSGVRYAVIVGQEYKDSGSVQLKNFADSSQSEVSVAGVITAIKTASN